MSDLMLNVQVIKETLLSLPEIQAITELKWKGQTKIMWLGAREDTPMPYITIAHIVGGSADQHVKARETDMTFEVIGHTASKEQAEALSNAIGKLNRLDPVTDNVPAAGNDYIQEIMPLMRRSTTQNNPFFEVGGLYRLQLAID